MAKTTDPAREIADFCDALKIGSGEHGDVLLAKTFGVKAWSAEFFLILNTFMERTQLVAATLHEMEMEDDHRKELVGHIRTLQKLGTPQVMRNSWNNSSGGLALVKGPSRAAIGSLSLSIRPIISYPLLNDAERDEVLEEVAVVIGKLSELQLGDRDFIRQALIDGLRQFQFRLERMKWLGWGYTIAGLREVTTAYFALEREFPNPQANTSAAAIQKYTYGLLATVWKVSGMATGARDRVDLALLAFRTAKLGASFVAGYITGG